MVHDGRHIGGRQRKCDGRIDFSARLVVSQLVEEVYTCSVGWIKLLQVDPHHLLFIIVPG